MGPFIEWYNQKEPTPMEIRIYPGQDCEFTLYEHEGDNYNYEQGAYSTINFKWNNENRTLTVCDREGEFPGMLKERVFNIILVNENNGTGVDISEAPDKVIEYNGKETAVSL
jgi:alpha-D-xyloside xylohydrolase